MAGRFNLDDYETVKTRKDRFAQDHSDGVIIAIPQRVTEEEAYFTVALWDSREEYDRGAERLASAVALGESVTDVQALLLMAPSSLGTAYEAKWMTGASKTSWTENAEESAIGRALDNRGYHGGGKCSREEVEKVERAESFLATQPSAEENPFGDGEIPAYPEARPIVAKMFRKNGVKELRQFFGHCATKEIAWADVVAFATEQDVDLFGDLTNVGCTKLRDMIKGGG